MPSFASIPSFNCVFFTHMFVLSLQHHEQEGYQSNASHYAHVQGRKMTKKQVHAVILSLRR